MFYQKRLNELKNLTLAFFLAALFAALLTAFVDQGLFGFIIILSFAFFVFLGMYWSESKELRNNTLVENEITLEAVVTKKDYIPSRRSGAMVHSTSPACYLIYFSSKDGAFKDEYFHVSEEKYNKIETGQKIDLTMEVATSVSANGEEKRLAFKVEKLNF